MGKFKNIYLYTKKISSNSYSKQTINEIKIIIKKIVAILLDQNCRVYFDTSCHQFLDLTTKSRSEVLSKKNCDLIIVIGGDGSLLKVIRDTIKINAPILGINKGRLGFLADLSTNKIKNQLVKILHGEFKEERRSLLQAQISRNHKKLTYSAVNDIVLYNGQVPKLIEFQIFINEQFVLQQRADGLVIATPTGSTAYALSAGGPILYPNLGVITLVPLYPHTLNTRPIVINENSLIRLKIINQDPNIEYGLNFDGQNNLPLQLNDQILIHKHPQNFTLIHPEDYNYFSILRDKLGWN